MHDISISITFPYPLEVTLSLKMGVKEIRTALKVDLNKHARDQPGLHVRQSLIMISLQTPKADWSRIDGTLTVRNFSKCIIFLEALF